MTTKVSPKFPNGMTFKQAGVSHLVGWHEVEDGNVMQGIVEVMGEGDTYIRHAKFSTGTSKKTTATFMTTTATSMTTFDTSMTTTSISIKM